MVPAFVSVEPRVRGNELSQVCGLDLKFPLLHCSRELCHENKMRMTGPGKVQRLHKVVLLPGGTDAEEGDVPRPRGQTSLRAWSSGFGQFLS